jgi:peptidoglycan hydrolase-like protein with peptidoglycan-binding domain
VRYHHVRKRGVVLGLAVGLAVVAAVSLYRSYPRLQGIHQLIPVMFTSPVAHRAPEALLAGWADDNVRAVQEKLREAGLYSGEIDGAYSSELAVALTRYQIRNGLPITGQLDVDTSEALGVKPAVATTAENRAQSSEVWRRLRTREQQTVAKTDARETSLPPADQSKPGTATESSSVLNVSTERLRDYVGAFVLAGLDADVGAEADFFADRVQYYDQSVMSREKIRQDLQRYAARWPERRFWLAGDITVEPQNGNRVRVTFPLRYELRKSGKHSSGKIDKTLVLESTGNDLQIVSVNERKAK